MDNTYKEQIKILLNKFDEMLSNCDKLSADFIKELSAHNKCGAVSFDIKSKDIVFPFYSFISNTTNLFCSFEIALSSVSKIIIDAESAYDKNSMTICDSIQGYYCELTRLINIFVKDCEREIAGSNGAPSITVIYMSFEKLYRKQAFIHEEIIDLLSTYEA